jgi:glycosyltransferase involved in cell wall biosynthesis
MLTMERPNGRRLMLLATSLSLAGGAELQVVEMARGMKERGWEVDVVSMLPPKPPSADLTSSGITLHNLQMRRGIGDPGAVLRLRQIIERIRPDVVHSHMTHANLLARMTRPFTKMPVLINTLHGYKMYSVNSTGSGMREFAHRLTDGYADMTTAVCQAAADRYVKIKVAPAHKMKMVPNGIRTPAFRPNERLRFIERHRLNLRDEFVWLAAGRLEMVKDYGCMLRSFVDALQSDARQVLLIAGEGSLAPELLQTALDLGVRENVRFLGFRDDISALMRAADGFVMSSIFEGMPLALLEAGASELPIVATRVGGNAETMLEGRSGLLVPARDPAALGRAMRSVVSMSIEERREMGRAGGDFVRGKYSLEAVLDQWEALYAQLTGHSVAGLVKEMA